MAGGERPVLATGLVRGDKERVCVCVPFCMGRGEADPIAMGIFGCCCVCGEVERAFG